MKLNAQVIFWIAVILVLTLLFGSPHGRYTESFYFVSLLLPVVVGTSYFFNEYLVPRYLLKKKMFKFVLYTMYMIIISLYLEVWIIMLAFMFLANYQFQNMIPVTTNVFVLAVTLYCIVFMYGFILLVRRSFLSEKSIQELEEEKDKQKIDYLSVRVDRKTSLIARNDIDYIESLGDYVKIMTSKNAPVITKEKISNLGEKLPESFLRIHRSFIINSSKIQSFSREEVIMNNDISLPISRTYKKKVIEALSKNHVIK